MNQRSTSYEPLLASPSPVKRSAEILQSMDTLIKALEKRGCEVRLSEWETKVRILDMVLGISINEQLVRENQ
jgi:hypothetical protein